MRRRLLKDKQGRISKSVPLAVLLKQVSARTRVAHFCLVLLYTNWDWHVAQLAQQRRGRGLKLRESAILLALTPKSQRVYTFLPFSSSFSACLFFVPLRTMAY